MDARHSHRDSGAVLLLVLVVAIVLSLVVLALANFVAADLRYSRIVTARADTLSSAESGIDFAVARLRANQTLCATDVADTGPVGLNGAAPTALPALNGTVTTLTCERLPGTFAAVAGWSVIVTAGDQAEAIKLLGVDRRIRSSIYVSDVRNIKVLAPDTQHLHMRDGDIWHRDSWYGSACSAQLPPDDLAPQLPGVEDKVIFDEPGTRGPICTTADWDDIVSAPPVPVLPPAVTPGIEHGVLTGSCLVFSPGHYDKAPVMPTVMPKPLVYFRSGDYWFDDLGEWVIEDDTRVSAGHPGTVSIPSDSCDAQRAADPNSGGSGATFYFGGDSRLRLGDRGSLEMFARRQGEFFVNIQALSATDGYAPASNPGPDLVETEPGSFDLVVGGLVWSPSSQVVLDSSAEQQLGGGVVAEKLWIGDSTSGSLIAAGFDVVQPATAASDAFIRLRSTSTKDSVTTTVEAIAQYRPQTSAIANRVAVNSSRVIAPN
jgi:hypothetical protein